MRCNNCGWENPAGNQKCEKCNAPLKGSMVEDSEARKEKYFPVAEELRGTVPESGAFGQQEQQIDDKKPQSCPHCGYPVSPVMNACPNCGGELKGAPAAAPAGGQQTTKKCAKCGAPLVPGAKFCPSCGMPLRMGTVPSWEMPQQGTFCTLKPVAWKGEEVTYQPISYSGNLISLNRANTDPNNNTITSKEQAVLIQEGGAWYIEDRSELHSTFVRVRRKTKLESGDVIVLGNRLFEFKG